MFSNHNSGGGDRALWWMKGLMPAALATSIIALFHDMLDVSVVIGFTCVLCCCCCCYYSKYGAFLF